ncbi:twin transmembrane helix small protein [Roseibium limicola]|uniref:Twin transmembrane helix small protein n=1 Tax=Roseibium limicola TaxID=2816037 RepID=A0A939ER06_9HYPH|nr:twin transmembrane helix small protein [Roseibium limicola]MBO0347111.1 twin transmembrane helix small protein [Roseibium limicola]
MEYTWDIVVRVGMVAVALVLLAGLWNMMRGGSANRSQQLMRWRVLLQFLVIILVMGGLYFFGGK